MRIVGQQMDAAKEKLLDAYREKYGEPACPLYCSRPTNTAHGVFIISLEDSR